METAAPRYMAEKLEHGPRLFDGDVLVHLLHYTIPLVLALIEDEQLLLALF
jgi:hypothetical protein